VGEGVVGGAVDRTKASQARCAVFWGEQGDAVRRIRNVQIDPGDVCQSTAVFMPLVEKVMAVVVTGSWAARISRENISVLIGLGVGAVGQEPELGDLGRWVFQGVSSKCDSYQFEPSGDHGVRRVHALIGGRNGVFDRPDPALAEGKGG